MFATHDALIRAALFFAAAVLYSSVGNAGATGYLAVMAFFGLAPEVMKPTALFLNVLVSSVALVAFRRAGHLAWSRAWPFVVGSVPLAFLGGAVLLPEGIFKRALGVIMLLAAARMVVPVRPGAGADGAIPITPALLSGGVIGLLSGLTGLGGGVFLGPLLLLTGWADARRTAGLSAALNLANSLAALVGSLASLRFLPDAITLWSAVVLVGGLLGSSLGSRALPADALRRVLATVIGLAGLKLILS